MATSKKGSNKVVAASAPEDMWSPWVIAHPYIGVATFLLFGLPLYTLIEVISAFHYAWQDYRSDAQDFFDYIRALHSK